MRLIDADALERSFRDVMAPDVPTYLNVITGMIKAMPTVGVEQVVRCKNCRYYDDFGNGLGWCEYSGLEHGSRDDLYCAFGERE